MNESLGLDLRTRRGNEEHVLRKIREYGKLSALWISENSRRACAVDRLTSSGRIVWLEGGEFPWCLYKIAEGGAT